MEEEKKEALYELWFVFGNNGALHHLSTHKFIQQFVECTCDYGEATPDIEKLRKHYKLRKTNPCYLIVKGILK